jgi:hypothetical protein
LLPYMKQSKHNAGEILFRKGDKADSMYYLMDGDEHHRFQYDSNIWRSGG